MATQSIAFSATGLPAAGNFIKSADVNATLQALINDYNLQVGPNKIAPGAVFASNIAAEAWTAWTPTITASGSMTVANQTINVADYYTAGKYVFYRIDVSGITFGGTASTTVYFTIPFTLFDTFSTPGSGTAADSAGTVGSYAFVNTVTQIGVRRYNTSNFTLGGSGGFLISGVARIA